LLELLPYSDAELREETKQPEQVDREGGGIEEIEVVPAEEEEVVHEEKEVVEVVGEEEVAAAPAAAEEEEVLEWSEAELLEKQKCGSVLTEAEQRLPRRRWSRVSREKCTEILQFLSRVKTIHAEHIKNKRVKHNKNETTNKEIGFRTAAYCRLFRDSRINWWDKRTRRVMTSLGLTNRRKSRI
jgi:hypothetical protein